MSLDYYKIKAKVSEESSFWASYSDLFMVMSVIFLLLYVVASLRSGTSGIQNMLESQKLKAEVQDYKKQIQAYNALKDDYLEKEAGDQEKKMYEELMGKLTLLQEEANAEKLALEKQARENGEKSQALNQYQQMVRNIINTNLLSNKKIKFRNEVIVKKNESIKEMDLTIKEQVEDLKSKSQIITKNEKLITEQENEIKQKQEILEAKKIQMANLETQVKSNEATIANNQNKISALNTELAKSIKELESTSSDAQMTKLELNKKITIMKLQNAKKIEELQTQTNEMKQNVTVMNQELAKTEEQLDQTKQKVAMQEQIKRNLENELKLAGETHKNELEKLQSEFEHKASAQRAALEKQLEDEKASASEKIKRLAKFKEEIAKEKRELDNQLASLKDEVGKVKQESNQLKSELENKKKEHGRYLASIKDLQDSNKNLSGDLKRAKQVIESKKQLAKKISDNLAKNGVKADVDGKTGDVTINFGEDYFDTGKSDLKASMRDTLIKFIPAYSKSLLEDEKVAKEISNIEIVGFSSPTYKGKYVDPTSLKEEDRAAVSYNLDLSYNRAKSIFSYIFDEKEMQYQYQKDLLPLVKVTGRSFLAEGVKGRDIASGLSVKEYCQKYQCDKSQKVIIKFNLKD